MKIILTLLVVLLIILHQDFWFWNDSRLLFSFLPIGLAYHMLISVLASAVWAWACFFAWPKDLDS